MTPTRVCFRQMTALRSLDRVTLVAPERRTVRVRRQRRLGPAALLSLGLHAAVIGLALFLMRRPTPVALEPANTPATVQLVMSPPGGEPAPAAAAKRDTPPTPKAPQQAPAASKAPPAPPAKTQAAAKAPPAAPVTAQAAPPPSPASVTAAAAPPPSAASPAPSPPTPRSASDKWDFSLPEAESDTNALVTGDMVVPASPDIKFHNRKPSYPMSAAWQGEQGAVVLLIHVAPDGLVSGADVVRSSGYAALDRAALDAVLSWHFLPSVKDGQPVPSDVPMRFVFALD